MTDIQSLVELKTRISSEVMVLAYISRPSCGVCTALKPKIIESLAGYPEIQSYYVNLDTIPEAAGEYSVFTLPGILLFVDGKETIREARYVGVDDLFEKIDRLHSLRFNQEES